MQSVALKSYESHVNTNPIADPRKSLGSGPAQGAGAASSLEIWTSKARAYYRAVMTGEAKKPSEQEWQQFLGYYSWAEQQMQGASTQWGDSVDADSEFSDAGMDQEDPFNGIAGPHGNRIHNEEKAEIGFLGENDLRRDIWSNDININVAAASVKVTVEETMDNSIQPPEKVTKVIMYDRATGATETYFIHDFVKGTDHLHINVPNGVTVQDPTGTAEIGKYQAPSATGADSESSVKNYPVTDVDGRKSVEPPLGSEERIEFTSNGDASSDEVYEFWGDYNLNLLPSDTVAVSPGNPQDPKGFTVEITHKNGKKTTVYTHEGFKGNINATPGKLTWKWGQSTLGGINHGLGDAQTPNSTRTRFAHSASGTEEIPEEFADSFTLNDSDATGSAEGAPVNSAPAAIRDTPASSINKKTKTAVYDDEQDVTLTNSFEGKVETYDISANGALTLHPGKQSDRFSVELIGSDIVITATNAAGKEIKYQVRADQISSINIDAPAGQVDGLENITDPTLKEKIQIDGNSIDDMLKVPESVQKLLGPDANLEAFQDVLQYTYGHDVPTDPLKFREWLHKNFNPPTMDEKLVKVLFKTDPKLKAALGGLDQNDFIQNITQVNEIAMRLKAALHKVIPNEDFNVLPLGPVGISITSADDESISTSFVFADDRGQFSTNPDLFDFNE